MNIKNKNSFLYRNSLTITFLSLAVITIVAQVLTGSQPYAREIGSPQSKPVDTPHSETEE